MRRLLALLVVATTLVALRPAVATDPYAFFDWDVSYVTAAPLGVKQQASQAFNFFFFSFTFSSQSMSSGADDQAGNCRVKDQIGSFFYFPSTGLQRAAGGFGGIVVNNRDVIAVPFGRPDGDITILIGDWYNKNHTDLRKMLDEGKDLGRPDGVLINGKGPYRYNDSLVPDGIEYETFNVHPGNRSICPLALISTVANESLWRHVTGVAVLRYSNSCGPASGPLPDPPQDHDDRSFSMNQARSVRWNLSAGAARPNPQGSFRYSAINVTQAYLLRSTAPVTIGNRRRATLNGLSFSPPATPLRLADAYGVKGVYRLDFPDRPPSSPSPPRVGRSIINGTYRGFMELIFQNNDTRMQSYHMDGYAFFVVGMDYGEWTEDSRGTYNKGDGVARSTIQVYPGAWAAVLVSLDNVGIWNVRSENLDSWYLGQEVYVRVVNPEDTSNKTEASIPDNALYCGQLHKYQKYGLSPTSSDHMLLSSSQFPHANTLH
ncbi:hypothetical protein HU200_049704 [Digitaria exilis]|uniref:Uncharacterized protein n=1 Tax=Digitaria exilis TaxID=1010633 RepID=A0A835AW50_9POAL|nr:hypothetical protein HU200_049704 [Digitaria exilis]